MQNFILRPYLDLVHVVPKNNIIWNTMTPLIYLYTIEMHQKNRVKLQFDCHQEILE